MGVQNDATWRLVGVVTQRRLLVVVVIAACSTPRPADVRSPPPTSSLFDQAVAYERGRGVPRDFRKAGELYDRLCSGGARGPGGCAKLPPVAPPPPAESDQ